MHLIIIIIMNTCCAPVSSKKDAHGAVTQAVQRSEKNNEKKINQNKVHE